MPALTTPTVCNFCGSDDLTDRTLARNTVETTCIECDATCLTVGDWHEWASGRTVRRAQAAVADTLAKHESN